MILVTVMRTASERVETADQRSSWNDQGKGEGHLPSFRRCDFIEINTSQFGS